MYSPYTYEVIRAQYDELVSDAHQARLRREAAGPSLFHRMAVRLRHESVDDGRVNPTGRHTPRRYTPRHTPTRNRWRIA